MSCSCMQSAGWIVIILFGFVFALLAVFLVSNVNCSPCLDFRQPDVALLIHSRVAQQNAVIS